MSSLIQKCITRAAIFDERIVSHFHAKKRAKKFSNLGVLPGPCADLLSSVPSLPIPNSTRCVSRARMIFSSSLQRCVSNLAWFLCCVSGTLSRNTSKKRSSLGESGGNLTRNLDSLSSYCCKSRLEEGDKMELLEVVSDIAFEGQNSAALLYHVSACRSINYSQTGWVFL